MIIIRNYKPTDKQSVTNFWQRSFPHPITKKSSAASFEHQLNEKGLLFVAEKSGQIVGSCFAGNCGVCGYIHAVTISIEMKQTGIGGKLVKHAIKQLQKIGCNQVKLEIAPENEQVDNFYQSLGFCVTEAAQDTVNRYTS